MRARTPRGPFNTAAAGNRDFSWKHICSVQLACIIIIVPKDGKKKSRERASYMNTCIYVPNIYINHTRLKKKLRLYIYYIVYTMVYTTLGRRDPYGAMDQVNGHRRVRRWRRTMATVYLNNNMSYHVDWAPLTWTDT